MSRSYHQIARVCSDAVGIYNVFLFLLNRKYYRLSVPQSWKDLEKTHSKEVVNQLKTVYTSVKDIELYIAGTFCHLIGQFSQGKLYQIY